MYIALKDKKKQTINLLINKKKEELYFNVLKIKQKNKHNHILEAVLQDYQKQHDYIIKNKVEQQKLLTLISGHIKNIQSSIEVTDDVLDKLQFEESKVFDEIERVRKDISRIAGNHHIPTSMHP